MTRAIGNEFYNDHEYQLRDQYHEQEYLCEVERNWRKAQMTKTKEESKTGLVTYEDLLMVQIVLEVLRDAFTQTNGSLRVRCDLCIDHVIHLKDWLQKEYNS